MKEYFEIYGAEKLEGEIAASGSKNACFPILAASLLLQNKITLSNVPNIVDIDCFLRILDDLGVQVKRLGNNVVEIDPTKINKTNIDSNLGEKIRGSYYFLGSLLSKNNKVTIPYPGGCNIGNRPIDLHLKVMKKFGVEVEEKSDCLECKNSSKSKKDDIVIELPFPSRGATINAILMSCLREGSLVQIVNSDQSPETSSLIDFLSQGGLKIRRLGSNIQIIGSKKINLGKFKIDSDKIEIATMLTMGLITNGEVLVRNVKRSAISQLIRIFSKMNVKYSIGKDSIAIKPNQLNKIKPTELISGLIFPCIDADFEPIFIPLLCKVGGESLIEDTINPERHSKFIPRLNNIGAKIKELSSTRAIIYGNKDMVFSSSDELIAKDIRGGVSQMIAALSANGRSQIRNVLQIDRGYERIEEKIKQIRGKIMRMKDL